MRRHGTLLYISTHALLISTVAVVLTTNDGRAFGQTIVVDTLTDSADPPFDADGFCGTGTMGDLPGADEHISLREAIIAANNTHGPHTITFASSLKGGTISIAFDDQDADTTADALPLLCGGGTTINGDLDGDNVPDITIDGSALGASDTTILAVSNDNTVNGLRILGAPNGGIGVSHAAAFSAAPEVSNTTISNNAVIGGGSPIYIFAGSTTPQSAGHISNTTIRGNAVSEAAVFNGINIVTGGAAGSSISGTMVTNNRVSANVGSGILVVANPISGDGTTIIDTSIADNEIFENVLLGISCETYLGRHNTLSGLRLERNTIHDNNSVGIGLFGGLCGAAENTLEAVVTDNAIEHNGLADATPGLVVVGGQNYACTGGPYPSAQQNQLTATIAGNTLKRNQGGHIIVSGGQVGADHNTVTVALTANTMSGGLTGIAIFGGVGTIGTTTVAANGNVVHLTMSDNRVQGTLGGILISGGSSGPASDNLVEAMVERNVACANPIGDLTCVGGFPGAAGFPGNTGTGNRVTGSISDNTATTILQGAGVPGNDCSAEQRNNTACAKPTPTSMPILTPTPTVTARPCVGDCDLHGTVTVDEVLTMVNIALENLAVTGCEPGDSNRDMKITVDEVLTAVNHALSGCLGSAANSTPPEFP